MLGHCLQLLDMSEQEAEQVFTFTLLRDLFSSAVRLGVMGPMQAQREQMLMQEHLDQWIAACQGTPQQINPIQEIVQGMHDRLYSRLFAS